MRGEVQGDRVAGCIGKLLLDLWCVAVDNLVKGAAGQAVQNMNLMFGLPENEGLCMPPMFP